jgi:hypothetical protein
LLTLIQIVRFPRYTSARAESSEDTLTGLPAVLVVSDSAEAERTRPANATLIV